MPPYFFAGFKCRGAALLQSVQEHLGRVDAVGLGIEVPTLQQV
jgi:hypothetical protein